MKSRHCIAILLALSSAGALAQTGTPAAQGSAASPQAARAVKRYPQPVRVGDLIDRLVLQPDEAQAILGRVAAITRRDGDISFVLRIGGVLGFNTRQVIVPVEAVALLGEHVALMGFTPEQLREFPTLDPSNVTALASDETIRVGLVRPFH